MRRTLPLPRLGLGLALGLAIALGTAPPARAQSVEPGRCLETLDDAEISARIAAIEGALRAARPRARRWFFVWTAINGALALGTASAAIALRDEPVRRDSNALASAGSAATLLLMFAPPHPAVFGVDRLQRMPARTRDQRLARLAEGTRVLEASAAVERVGTGPLNYVLAGGYAAFTGLYLGLRYDGGGVTIALAVAGTLAVPFSQILSAPTDALGDWDRYRSGSTPCMAPALRSDPAPELGLAPSPGGLAFAVRF